MQEEPQIQQPATQPGPAGAVSSIEGLPIYDENAKKIGNAKQVGIDSNQSVVLLITQNDGTEGQHTMEQHQESRRNHLTWGSRNKTECGSARGMS